MRLCCCMCMSFTGHRLHCSTVPLTGVEEGRALRQFGARRRRREGSDSDLSSDVGAVCDSGGVRLQRQTSLLPRGHRRSALLCSESVSRTYTYVCSLLSIFHLISFVGCSLHCIVNVCEVEICVCMACCDCGCDWDRSRRWTPCSGRCSI